MRHMRGYGYRPEGVSMSGLSMDGTGRVEEYFARMDAVGESCQVDVDEVLNALYSAMDYGDGQYDRRASVLYFRLGRLADCINRNTDYIDAEFAQRAIESDIQTGPNPFRIESFDM